MDAHDLRGTVSTPPLLDVNGLARQLGVTVRFVRRLVEERLAQARSKANPVRDVEVGRTNRIEMVFLEPDEIMTLAREITTPPPRYRREERRRDGYPEYGLLVRFAAFTGLRAGELVALRPSDLDLLRRRVEVNASVSEAYGQLQVVPTKTYQRRSVPIPRSLIDELATQIRHGSEYVWQGPHGGPLRYSNWFKRHSSRPSFGWVDTSYRRSPCPTGSDRGDGRRSIRRSSSVLTNGVR